jgi:hypothetical protein
MSLPKIDFPNVIRSVYDVASNRLRVDAVATVATGIIEVVITDTTDSIKIGDGSGTYLDINADGSINTKPVGTTAISGTVSTSPSLKITPTIANLSVPTSGVEQSYALPASTREFMLKARGFSTVQFAYTSGDSGTDYISLPPGCIFTDKDLPTSVTIYYQTSKSGETVEVLSWT